MEVLKPNSTFPQPPFGLASISKWEVDWENFQREYPQVPGRELDWKIRLAEAFKPTFADTKSG